MSKAARIVRSSAPEDLRYARREMTELADKLNRYYDAPKLSAETKKLSSDIEAAFDHFEARIEKLRPAWRAAHKAEESKRSPEQVRSEIRRLERRL